MIGCGTGIKWRTSAGRPDRQANGRLGEELSYVQYSVECDGMDGREIEKGKKRRDGDEIDIVSYCTGCDNNGAVMDHIRVGGWTDV